MYLDKGGYFHVAYLAKKNVYLLLNFFVGERVCAYKYVQYVLCMTVLFKGNNKHDFYIFELEFWNWYHLPYHPYSHASN